MENNRDQMDEKNNETITSTQENAQERSQSTERLNIEDIKGEMLRKEDKKKPSYYCSRNSSGSIYCDCVIFL